MINLKLVDSKNKDFINLVKKLDAELKISDGEDHDFYNQFNKIDGLKHVIVAYKSKVSVGCGAIKEYDPYTMEIKRMFVDSNHRGNGIATMILKELENWALELNFQKCILETGINQPDAIRLYHKNKYVVISNYGQYANTDKSVCFEKVLATSKS